MGNQPCFSLGILLNDTPIGRDSHFFVMIILGLVAVAFLMNGERYRGETRLMVLLNQVAAFYWILLMLTTFTATAPQLTLGFVFQQLFLLLVLSVPPIRQLFLKHQLLNPKKGVVR